jgi:hypothetical protein
MRVERKSMKQDWFEMKAVRKRKLNAAVWIPLRAENLIEKTGQYGFPGFKEEFFGAGTIAVPIVARDSAGQLGWSDIGIAKSHRPRFHNGIYSPSDIYDSHVGDFRGIHLVLEQHMNRFEVNEWHLNQDLVLALALKREGDVWVSPKEGVH